MTTEKTIRTRGRPAAFDQDEALEKALKVFWEKGYEGASMSALTAAMGINKPSLYAAFGNKEALFAKALGHYLSGPVSYFRKALQMPTARESVECFLKESARFLTDPDNPRGCLIAIGGLACGDDARQAQQMLIAYRKGYEDLLRQRFERARSEGDLPESADPRALARLVAMTHQGMSVQAINGATQEELLEVIDLGLRGWPN
jgi:AcrR family transcriptional regulator